MRVLKAGIGILGLSTALLIFATVLILASDICRELPAVSMPLQFMASCLCPLGVALNLVGKHWLVPTLVVGILNFVLFGTLLWWYGRRLWRCWRSARRRTKCLVLAIAGLVAVGAACGVEREEWSTANGPVDRVNYSFVWPWDYRRAGFSRLPSGDEKCKIVRWRCYGLDGQTN